MNVKDLIKRSVSVLLVASMAASLASCAGEGDSNTNTNDVTTNVATTEPKPTDGLEYADYSLTDEQKAQYSALIQANLARAQEITNVTVDSYFGEERNGDLKIARYYSVLAGSPTTIDVSSVWHYTAVMQMVSRMYETSESEDTQKYYSDLYIKLYTSLGYYKGTADVTTYVSTTPVTYYGVNRASRVGQANVAGDQAVYDDQMWIIMDLVDMYSYTGIITYLEEAVRLADICIAGWDYSTDGAGKEYGGITWGPSYATKHTCSNAPLIEPLVSISEAYTALGDTEKAQYYLDWAEKVYEWVRLHLSSDGVYGDLLGTSRELDGDKYVTTSQGSVDGSKYTYNTGTMLSGAAALYRATGNKSYLTQGKRLAKNAYNTFAASTSVDGVVQYPITSQTTWFNAILLQGFIDLAPFDENCLMFIDSFQKSIDYAYEHYNNGGFLPRDYISGWSNRSEYDTSKNVMDQASAAQIYAMLRTFYMTIVEE